MKNSILPLLLTTAPLFAGEPAPMMAPAPTCDCPQGWTVGLEVLGLKAYQSEGEYQDDSDLDAGLRGSIGYEFGDCLFVKATGFGYDTDIDTSGSDFNEDEYDIDLTTAYVDLVVGQHFNQCDKLTLSPYVGIAWASFEENWDGDFSEFDSDFDGLGIVVGIDATRSLGNNFSVYGKAKQAVMFGETDYEQTFRGDGGFRESESTDNVVFISEFGIGLQYDFSFSNVAANVRAGVEGQWWAGPSDGDSEDVGFGGFVVGANFRF